MKKKSTAWLKNTPLPEVQAQVPQTFLGDIEEFCLYQRPLTKPLELLQHTRFNKRVMADLEALKTALTHSPENIPLLLLLAQGYQEEFQLEESQEHFERILRIDPEHTEARLGLIHLLDLSGKISEAILRLEDFLKKTPDHAPAWLLRSKLALIDDTPHEALSYYQRALDLDSTIREEDLKRRILEAQARQNHSSKNNGHHHHKPPSTPLGMASGQDGNTWQTPAYQDGDDDEDDFDDDDEDDQGLEASDPLVFLEKADTKFEDVGGMEELKEQIRMKIIYPLQNRELFEAYGKKPGGGVLLYGPPGCGKTLISKATAGEIKSNFLALGLHQILDMWLGQSEEKLHQIFELARKNAPTILFFDEIDALAADRRDLRGSAGRTLINQFLAELDGSMSKNDGVLVLGATNAPWHLDSAFLRPGRFDRVIFVPPPDLGARESILDIMAQDKPTSELDTRAIAKKTDGFSGADLKAIFDQSIEATLVEAMTEGNIVPLTTKRLLKTRKTIKPSTTKWFESAKNHALYANQSGLYDDILKYVK